MNFFNLGKNSPFLTEKQLRRINKRERKAIRKQAKSKTSEQK